MTKPAKEVPEEDLETEEEEEEGEEENEEEDEDAEILKTWELESLVIELHGFDDHDEILMIPYEGEEGIAIVSLEELHEVQEGLREAREIMVKNEAKRKA
jgi:hypothetical protein